MDPYLQAATMGIIFGFLARIVMMRTDSRQYPSYPQGRTTNLSFGFIAAFIGAVAVPSFLESDWAAVTFLGLASTQFREVRNMERETLQKIDEMELVPRGEPFIEGMAQAFESRNYLVMFTAMVTTLVAILFNHFWAIVIGVILLIMDKVKMSGKTLKRIADFKEGELHFEGPDLFVDDIHLMNVGLEENKKIIKEKGIGIVVEPKNANSVVTLAYLGQRQAMLHHASNILGVYRDSGEPALIPISKRHIEDGRVGLLLLPQEKDVKQAILTLKEVPILDSAIRLPTEDKKTSK